MGYVYQNLLPISLLKGPILRLNILNHFLAIFDYLAEQKLINPNISTTWKYFIQIWLEKNDFEEAVNTFEKIAVEKNLLPYRFKLMEVLIQNNKLDQVQRVLDISISIVGEEETLYNAIFIFLSLGKSRNVQKLMGNVQFLL